ncbi:MAG: ABC transporter substrate-binding protein [Meiothermus sp.]|nr:ABC transporter substrate-binding protein [Meiothermus sp.]
MILRWKLVFLMGLWGLAAAQPDAPKVGGTVVFAQTVEPDSLHPLKTAGGMFSVNIMQHIAGTLVTFDPASGRYIPYLAEGWTISPDGRTYTFRLKRGVRFSDGTPVTARDWVYAIEQAQGPLNRGLTASVITAIRRASAPDDYTLRLELSAPSAPLLFNLTVPTVTPIPKAAVARLGNAFDRTPVTAGPFRVREWVTGRRVVLERRTDWRSGPAFAPGPAYIQTLEFRIITDPVVLQSAIRAGEVDVAMVSPRDAVRLGKDSRYRLFQVLGTAMSPYLSLNQRVPALADLRVRQALNLAVNKDVLIRLIAAGNARPQYGPLSRVDIGYWPGAEEIGYRFDLERAKALLAQAGYTPGPDGVLQKGGQPLRFTLKTEAENSRLAEVLQQQFRAAGIEVVIRQNETGVHYTELDEGKYDLALAGLDFGEADLLYDMFHSQGFINWVGVKNPQLDRLLDEQRTTLNPAARQRILDQAQRIIVEQAYVVPLYSSTNNFVVSRRLEGVTYRPYGFTAYSVLLLGAWVR